jgi:hypothetical protein
LDDSCNSSCIDDWKRIDKNIILYEKTNDLQKTGGISAQVASATYLFANASISAIIAAIMRHKLVN